MSICIYFFIIIIRAIANYCYAPLNNEEALAKHVYKSEGVLYLIQDINYSNKNMIVRNKDNSTFVVLSPSNMTAKFKDKTYDFKKENLDKRLLLDKYKFDPLAFNLEYGLVLFEIANQNNNAIEIYINSRKDIIKKINFQSNLLAKETWLQHIKRSEISYNSINNPLLTRPINGSKVNIPKSELSQISWHVIKFSGMWVEVESFDGCNAAPNKKYKGWIKWTDGKRPLLTLYYDC